LDRFCNGILRPNPAARALLYQQSSLAVSGLLALAAWSIVGRQRDRGPTFGEMAMTRLVFLFVVLFMATPAFGDADDGTKTAAQVRATEVIWVSGRASLHVIDHASFGRSAMDSRAPIGAR